MIQKRYYGLLALAAAFLVLLALFATQVMTPLSGIVQADLAIDAWFIALRTPLALALATALTYLGNIVLVAALTLLFTLALYATPAVRIYSAGLVIAVAGAAISSYVLKALIGRVRPADLIPGSFASTSSFPSSHAALALALYGFCAFYFSQCYPRYRAAILAVAALLILAIGATRLYLGVHFMSDVLAAYLLGGAWLMIGAAVIDRAESEVRESPSI